MSEPTLIQERAAKFFPATECYQDAAGKKREFLLTLSEPDKCPGYIVSAVENGVVNGYEFDAFSEINPFEALGKVRKKIRKGLATKYLVHEHGRRLLSFDELSGRIGDGGIVVDGTFASFAEFAEILQIYEGSSFSLSINDSAE